MTRKLLVSRLVLYIYIFFHLFIHLLIIIDHFTVFWWPAAKNEPHNGTLFLFEILALTVHKTQLTEDQTKPRQRRQRERRQTKGFISKTIAVHVRAL